MSLRSTLSIDSLTIKMAAQLIDEMQVSQAIICYNCQKKSDMTCYLVSLISPMNNQVQNMLVCRECFEKVIKNAKVAHLTTMSSVYSLMRVFNQFDIKQLSRVLVDKILIFLAEIKDWNREFQRELLGFMSKELLSISNVVSRTIFPSIKQKRQFVLLVCVYFIDKLKGHQELQELFNKQGWLYDCISTQMLSFFTRLIRNEIQIKLETLKTLLHILCIYKEPSNIQYFCQEAMFLLDSPLQSFYKAEQYTKNVVYSIDRRQIQLKSFEQSELTVEQYLQLQEIVRLNLPLRNKPVVFRIKCLSRPEQVKLGFFFMRNEDYLNQAEYLRPFEPFQIVFDVYPSKSNLDKMQQQDFTPELLRPQLQFSKIINQSKIEQNDKKLTINDGILELKRQKPLFINWKKKVKNVDTERRKIEDGNLIELRYDSNSLSMRNLSFGGQPFRWKLNRKCCSEIKNMVIFACVTLTGPDCSVEYVSDWNDS